MHIMKKKFLRKKPKFKNTWPLIAINSWFVFYSDKGLTDHQHY